MSGGGYRSDELTPRTDASSMAAMGSSGCCVSGTACAACAAGRAEKSPGTCEQCASGSEPDGVRVLRDGHRGHRRDVHEVRRRQRAEGGPAGTRGLSGRPGREQPRVVRAGLVRRRPDRHAAKLRGVPRWPDGGVPRPVPAGRKTARGSAPTCGTTRSAASASAASSPNSQCRRSCGANSSDDGWGLCVCDPGYVFTLADGAFYGPPDCVGRTAGRCGAADDPGTCEPGGTWNSSTARCDCDEGYERSEDGRSCQAFLRHRAGVCERNLGGLPVRLRGSRTRRRPKLHRARRQSLRRENVRLLRNQYGRGARSGCASPRGSPGDRVCRRGA